MAKEPTDHKKLKAEMKKQAEAAKKSLAAINSLTKELKKFDTEVKATFKDLEDDE